MLLKKKKFKKYSIDKYGFKIGDKVRLNFLNSIYGKFIIIGCHYDDKQDNSSYILVDKNGKPPGKYKLGTYFNRCYITKINKN